VPNHGTEFFDRVVDLVVRREASEAEANRGRAGRMVAVERLQHV
jgi:hypothetical protein